MVKPPVYAMSAKLMEGTVLFDTSKRNWILGTVLGQGGFGCIYTAKSQTSELFDKVIKIEPVKNGPLFTEINFYKRVAKEEDIKNWIKLKKLDFLGMPKYVSSGINEENRFLVMDRYGDDLHKSLMNGRLSAVCILQISINMLDILEYIHSMEYSHADIKALNIMRGYNTPTEVYLLDFGMTSKFSEKGVHKPEKIDPKCKHNGTLEFSPRDSHAGLLPSRRGDIESLLYNMIFWLTWNDQNQDSSRSIGHGRLPWLPLLQGLKSEKVTIAIINKVAESKLTYMKSPKTFIETVKLDGYSWSKYLVKMLTETSKYMYEEKPNYDGLRKDIATIIAEIEQKSININVNRRVNWDSRQILENTKIKKSFKRASTELIGRDKDIAIKKKSKLLNNSNKRVEKIIPSERETKKVTNIFKNFECSDDSMNEICEKESNDNGIIAMKNRGTKKKSYKHSSKENASEDIADSETKSVPISAHTEKIPGLKQLDLLIKKNKIKSSASEAVRTSNKNTTRKEDLGIIPGLKSIRELKAANNLKTPKRYSRTPTNTVSCQTTPSISKNQ